MKKSFLFLFFILFGFVSIAQEPELDAAQERARYNKQIQPLVQAAKEIAPDPDAEFDVQVEIIHENSGSGNEYIALPKADKDDADSGLLDDFKSKYLPQLKKNPMANRNIEEVKANIREKVKGSNWELFFNNYPKVLNFVADLLSHDDAFLRFASILTKKNKLNRYFFCFVVVLIITLYWNYKLPKELNFFNKLGRKFVFYMGSLGVNLLSFYMLFRYELSPTIDIFIRNFF